MMRRRTLQLLAGLLFLTLSSSALTSGEAERGEYCFPNPFNVSCGPNEVVLMQSALYGRMRRIPCLTSVYDIGCHADVLHHVDRMCSGRRSCLVNIPDSTLHDLSPCPSDLMGYLEASYQCVRVESAENCRLTRHFPVSGSTGYLANVATKNIGCNYPWVITLPQGQRINITLYDFGITSRDPGSSTVCHVYAKIQERALVTEGTICGVNTRQKGVYISETNSVEVTLNDRLLTERNPVYFLLKYEAIGCVDPVVPQGAWFQRTGEKAVVSCNFTSQIWHIVCHETRWVGKLDNCTIPTTTANKGSHTGSPKSTFPYGLLVAIITGVLLGILIGVAMLAVVLAINRRRRRGREAAASRTYSPAREIQGSPFVESHKTMLHAPYGYTHMHGSGHSAGCPSGCPLHSPSMKASVMTSQDGGWASTGRCVSGRRNHTYEKPGYKRAHSLSETGPLYHEFDVVVPGLQAQEGFQHELDNKDNDNKYVPNPSGLTD